jgi:hypothetical protein
LLLGTRADSVKRYAKIELDLKKELMNRKVVSIKENGCSLGVEN